MSSNIEIVIEAENGKVLPMRSELDEHASQSDLELPTAGSSYGDYTEQLGDRPAHIVIQWWDEKYGGAEMVQFCETLAKARPDLKIHFEEEYDDEGAGGYGYEWQGGRPTKSGCMLWVWEDVKLVSE